MAVGIKRQYDLSGGVNYSDDLDSLAENELGNLRNVRIDGTDLIQRGGQTKLNVTAVEAGLPVHSLFRFYKNNGSDRYTIGFAGTKMLNISSTPADWETTPTVFSSGVRMSGAVMDDAFYFSNATDGMKKTTGPGTVTAVSGAPAAVDVVAHATSSRLFAHTGQKRINYTGIGNADNWTTAGDAGFFDVPFTEGENIKVIFSIPEGVLAIFSNSSFHTLTGTGPADFFRREIDPSIGCKAPLSIAAGRGGIYFLANNNKVYWTKGGAPLPVSRNIDDLLEEGVTADYVNARAWVEGTRYHLWVPYSGGNIGLVIVKDWNLPNPNPQAGWVIDDAIDVASVAVDNGVNGQVYTGDFSGFVQQQDMGTTDNGVAITSYWETTDDTFGEPDRRKKVRGFRPKLQPTGNFDVTISVATDGGALTEIDTANLTPSATLWGSFLWLGTGWGGARSWISERVSNIRNCYSYKIRYTVTNPFRFYGHSIYYRSKFPKL